MFKCYCCEKISQPHEKPVKKVMKTRNKIYPERRDKEGEVIDNGGTGVEIVEEANFCQTCARN